MVHLFSPFAHGFLVMMIDFIRVAKVVVDVVDVGPTEQKNLRMLMQRPRNRL